MAFKFGKLAPKKRLGGPCFGNYCDMKAMRRALPVSPVAWGWEYKIPRDGWRMYGNDLASDCVLAMFAHLIAGWTSNKGAMIAPTDDQIAELYKTLTGFDWRDPDADPALDAGLVLVDALDYWQHTGIECTDAAGKISTHKILGHASLDVQNLPQLNAATYIFEGIPCGIQCPQSAVQDLSNWKEDPKSPIVGLHGVPRLGYGRLGGHFISWGVSIPHDVPFLVNLDEAHIAVSEDQINATTGKSLSGFDQAALLDAMAAA